MFAIGARLHGSSRSPGSENACRDPVKGVTAVGTQMLTQLMAPRALAALACRHAPVAGCVVGPDYKRPPISRRIAEFRSQVGPSEANSIADLPWWSVFNDKALQALIARPGEQLRPASGGGPDRAGARLGRRRAAGLLSANRLPGLAAARKDVRSLLEGSIGNVDVTMPSAALVTPPGKSTSGGGSAIRPKRRAPTFLRRRTSGAV